MQENGKVRRSNPRIVRGVSWSLLEASQVNGWTMLQDLQTNNQQGNMSKYISVDRIKFQ